MRVLMKVQMPVESGNEAIRNGKLPQIIAQTLETVKAEAAYFTTMDGKRTMLVVFDLKAVSDMLRIAEPLFMGIDVSVDFMPCMNADDLKGGLSAV
jgi:hypothetical protein